MPKISNGLLFWVRSLELIFHISAYSFIIQAQTKTKPKRLEFHKRLGSVSERHLTMKFLAVIVCAYDLVVSSVTSTPSLQQSPNSHEANQSLSTFNFQRGPSEKQIQTSFPFFLCAFEKVYMVCCSNGNLHWLYKTHGSWKLHILIIYNRKLLRAYVHFITYLQCIQMNVFLSIYFIYCVKVNLFLKNVMFSKAICPL